MSKKKIIHSYRKEFEFVLAVCKRIGLQDIKVNPQLRRGPYIPSLIVERRIAEVKYQSVPFYRANELYGLDPRYTVAINHNEFHRLLRDYPWMDIFFWIEWLETSKRMRHKKYTISPLAGVWRTSIKQMNQLIAQKKAHLHRHGGKRFSTYIFDLRNFEELEALEAPLPIDLCFLDLETSGFSIRKGATILAIGAVLRSGPTFYSLVRPTQWQWDAAIPKALETNGLTWDDLSDAPTLFEAREKFIEFLSKHQIKTGQAIFVGQYPQYDMRFLKHTMYMWLDWIDAPLDSLLDIRKLYRIVEGWGRVPKLDYYSGHDISRAVDVPEEPLPHNALDGAKVARRNYLALDMLMRPK